MNTSLLIPPSVHEELSLVNHELIAKLEELRRQRLLAGELNHRIRNMLQIVISLTNQTLRRATDIKEFEKTFMGRIQALARAYELLSREGWRTVPLVELVRTQLSPFASDDGGYTAQGDNIVLTSNAALAIGMVLYELATNATKYGALSAPGGRVALTWKMQTTEGRPHELVMRWAESGGPQVREPTRSGFGSELVKRQLKYELNGHAALKFYKGGLQATLTVPASDAVLAGDAKKSLQ